LSPPERLLPVNEAWGTIGWDVTADGSVVVGRLYLSDEILDRRADIVAGIWTEEAGRMVPLQDLLVSEYGLGDSLAGYHLTGVYDVTDDGRFMVGHAINPAGLDEAWLVDLGPPALVAGDFNASGTVDAADYVVWRDGLGTDYTQADYDVWRTNFGQTSANSVGAGFSSLSSTNPGVPEPPAVCLVLFGLALHPFSARSNRLTRCRHRPIGRRRRIQAWAGLAE
jgi:hypothetical protein